jgi:hypothetical protein
MVLLLLIRGCCWLCRAGRDGSPEMLSCSCTAAPLEPAVRAGGPATP